MGDVGKKINGLPFKRDSAGKIIRSGQSIVDILNVSVTSGAWKVIRLSNVNQMACKAILVGMRDGSNWKISHLVAGTRYKTIRGSLSIDIVKEKSSVLFYVKSVAATGTLEVILLD